jgi:hypothetical protein
MLTEIQRKTAVYCFSWPNTNCCLIHHNLYFGCKNSLLIITGRFRDFNSGKQLNFGFKNERYWILNGSARFFLLTGALLLQLL